MTHPHDSVAREVADHFVPVKLESASHREVARAMGVRWLPGLVVAGEDERAAHVVVGFLPPADLIPELRFGRAIFEMGRRRYDQAHALLQEVARAPGEARAPEALYWLGISRYRHTKAFSESIRGPWGEILERWPDSQWARKVGYALGRPPIVA